MRFEENESSILELYNLCYTGSPHLSDPQPLQPASGEWMVLLINCSKAPIAGTIILSSASTHPTPPMDSDTSETQKLTYVKASTSLPWPPELHKKSSMRFWITSSPMGVLRSGSGPVLSYQSRGLNRTQRGGGYEYFELCAVTVRLSSERPGVDLQSV